MLTPIALLAAVGIAIGALLAVTGRRMPQQSDSPVERVNALLPQTQCGQCGYTGCRPYAEAIVAGDAHINQCAPGGNSTVTALADLLGRPTDTVNPNYGIPGAPQIAVIDEAACIGCALCIDACPVDAIIGAAQFTHTVIRSECTGCELCLQPCPVDCITLISQAEARRENPA